MKKGIILVLAMAFISMSFVNPIKGVKQKFNVNVETSTITWKGYKPTGTHNGTINMVSGEIYLEDGNLKSGSFVADMTSIKDADGSSRLEGHLKSPDFFDIKEFSTSKFEITNSEEKDGKTIITGDLTIKGIVKQISFPATITSNEETVTILSEVVKINRADFNIKYKSKSFFNNLKEKFINDEFDLQVNIVANI